MTAVDVWEHQSSEEIADCRVFRVRREFCRRERDGKAADFYVVDSPDWVNVVATTKGGEVLLIEQFRHGTREVNLELPGGIVDPGESPEAAARRELLEETGYGTSEWTALGSCRPNPAILTNTMHYFLARNCEKISEPALDPNEGIVTRPVDEKRIDELIGQGSIDHSLVVAAFFYYRLYAAGLSEAAAS